MRSLLADRRGQKVLSPPADTQGAPAVPAAAAPAPRPLDPEVARRGEAYRNRMRAVETADGVTLLSNQPRDLPGAAPVTARPTPPAALARAAPLDLERDEGEPPREEDEAEVEGEREVASASPVTETRSLRPKPAPRPRREPPVESGFRWPMFVLLVALFGLAALWVVRRRATGGEPRTGAQ